MSSSNLVIIDVLSPVSPLPFSAKTGIKHAVKVNLLALVLVLLQQHELASVL